MTAITAQKQEAKAKLQKLMDEVWAGQTEQEHFELMHSLVGRMLSGMSLYQIDDWILVLQEHFKRKKIKQEMEAVQKEADANDSGCTS